MNVRDVSPFDVVGAHLADMEARIGREGTGFVTAQQRAQFLLMLREIKALQDRATRIGRALGLKA